MSLSPGEAAKVPCKHERELKSFYRFKKVNLSISMPEMLFPYVVEVALKHPALRLAKMWGKENNDSLDGSVKLFGV